MSTTIPLHLVQEMVEHHCLADVTPLVRKLLNYYEFGTDPELDSLMKIRLTDQDYVQHTQSRGCSFVPNQDNSQFAILHGGKIISESLMPDPGTAAREVCNRFNWIPPSREPKSWFYVSPTFASIMVHLGGSITSFKMSASLIWIRDTDIPLNQDVLVRRVAEIHHNDTTSLPRIANHRDAFDNSDDRNVVTKISRAITG